MYGREIVIHGVYGPINDRIESKEEKIFENPRTTIEKVNRRKEAIKVEDLNSRTGKRQKDTVMAVLRRILYTLTRRINRTQQILQT